MAAPSAPAAPKVLPGPEPQSIVVYGNDVATATYYNCYLDQQTGVAAAQYIQKFECETGEVPKWLIRNVPFIGKIFIALTAFNSGDEESTASTETSIAGNLIAS